MMPSQVRHLGSTAEGAHESATEANGGFETGFFDGVEGAEIIGREGSS